MADSSDKSEEYGVLLYYKYTTIPDLQHLYTFYESNCNSLALLGRVRLAPHGVNVTVGGKLSSLEEHIATVKMNSLFEGTDFKLASCHQPSNDRVAKECGFTSLSIRIVKELVTFSSHPLLKSPEISNAGRHLSATEFHTALQTAGKFLDQDKERKIVLLDARNVYETRIGKFDTPNVETLDPGIRQYSDLPSWIDDNSEQLRGSNVLMYCTGGIRCEMASAYVRSKGAGFENVFQLYGGIQRYLEQYPDGGFFKGKNFVFDPRVSVGSSDGNILGTCLVCSCSYDDYTSRSRCIHCRMLVLVCDICQEKTTVYVCELCKESNKNINSIQSSENGNLKPSVSVSKCTSNLPQCPSRNGTGTPKKLRILCLHGFRQNASSFKGRTGSLIKKLKNIADLIFINAAHELPFMYQPNQTDQNHDAKSSLPPINCNKKFAWLISPNSDTNPTDEWKVATCPFDPLQYRTQTGGYDESLAYLKKVFLQSGPFDGILGFSQGAAMAALLCAQKEKVKDGIDFRFAILCSGFVLSLLDRERVSIKCPSLHIFGNEQGEDRQISNWASRDLANLFDDDCSVIIEHDNGHIIPTRPPYIDQIKDFLQHFL